MQMYEIGICTISRRTFLVQTRVNDDLDNFINIVTDYQTEFNLL